VSKYSRVGMRWSYQAGIVAVNGGGVKGLEAAMRAIKEVADQYVPFDQGALEASGEITLRENTARGATIRLTYHKIYGAYLHQHPEYHFQNGRRAKFLEKANTTARRAALGQQASVMKTEFKTVKGL
jgi:anaerobic glycerol-3-phosphate dehydrogenase